MNELFDLCVAILYWISDVSGLMIQRGKYLIFVIIHPIITIALIYYVMLLRRKLKK